MSLVIAATGSAATLFPEPLHIVREVTDPITESTSVIHEYCSGDRIVTVQGARTVIADYARQEMTEIDRNAGTFSITPFADLARATESMAMTAGSAPADARVLASHRSSDGRAIERFEFTDESSGTPISVVVGIDPNIRLSAAAAQSLIGAAFPNRTSFTHRAILRAASPSRAGRRIETTAVTDVALPSEHSVTYEMAGERLTWQSKITSVDRDLPPEDLTTIPPGSRRVEARTLAIPQAIDELDRLPLPRP